MAFIRLILVALFCVIGACPLHADGLISDFLDSMDKRPAVKVLFLGNSRTFYNDMPYMIPKIADSAHSLKKYQITMHAKSQLTLEDLWNDPTVQELLQRQWDYVVLQGGSSEQINALMDEKFQIYGTKLIRTAKANGSKPVLLVAWRCSENYYPQLKGIYPQFYGMIQNSYSNLAKATGTSMVNVGRVWEKVGEASPAPMTVDGNHPTLRSSYLIALMFYRYFSGNDLANVTYAPGDVTAEDATLLKEAAMH